MQGTPSRSGPRVNVTELRFPVGRLQHGAVSDQSDSGDHYFSSWKTSQFLQREFGFSLHSIIITVAVVVAASALLLSLLWAGGPHGPSMALGTRSGAWRLPEGGGTAYVPSTQQQRPVQAASRVPGPGRAALTGSALPSQTIPDCCTQVTTGLRQRTKSGRDD